MNKSEDIFDIVDKNDTVIGSDFRSVIHQKGLLHRASHIWIFNSKGEYLLQRRSASKDRFPNTWTSSVSGHVDSGETYEQAAIREMSEEIGLTPSPVLKKIAYIKACEETENEFVWLFKTTSNGPFKAQESEVSELKWATPDEVDRILSETPEQSSPSFTYLWKTYRTTAVA